MGPGEGFRASSSGLFEAADVLKHSTGDRRAKPPRTAGEAEQCPSQGLREELGCQSPGLGLWSRGWTSQTYVGGSDSWSHQQGCGRRGKEEESGQVPGSRGKCHMGRQVALSINGHRTSTERPNVGPKDWKW